jgi:hypothetical protein
MSYHYAQRIQYAYQCEDKENRATGVYQWPDPEFLAA